MRLTDRIVRDAKPEARARVIWDVDVRGLGLRVLPSGAKSFVLKYRSHGGGRRARQRWLTLGAGLTLGEARKEARRLMAQVRLGADPAGDKSRKRETWTVAELCDHYLEEGTATKKPSTLTTDRGRIERHIKPLLGKRLITEVTSADVERFLRAVAKGKTRANVKTGFRGRAIVTGGKGAATRTVGLLGGIFSFAMSRKLVNINPVRGVKRYADQKGERFLSAVEMTRLGDTLLKLEADGTNKSAIAIIRILALSGARRSEIATLRWSEVDLERSCLRLANSKTGAKVIPLGPPAVIILGNWPRTGEGYVFPAQTGHGPYLGVGKVWGRVRKAAGLQDVRLHDLRHSFASVALLGGNALAVIGKLLGHADVKTTQRYAHLADDPVKAAANRVSEAIDRSMRGQSAPVVPLRR